MRVASYLVMSFSKAAQFSVEQQQENEMKKAGQRKDKKTPKKCSLDFSMSMTVKLKKSSTA